MSIRILNAADVKKALPMQDAILAMKSAFKQLAHHEAIMPQRMSLPIKKQNAAMLSMPAYLAETNALGLKVITIFPNNSQLGLPTIPGMVLMLNANTGVPEALLDGASITKIRTGAVSGLATDLLSAPSSKKLAIIGSGAQSYTQMEAVCAVRDIKEVWIYSRQKQHAESFKENANFKGIQINVADTVAQAVKEADIICTATPATSPLFSLKDVKQGAHINAVGSHTPEMCELDPDMFSHAEVVVDQRQAALAEAGEIIQAIKQKYLSKDKLIELSEIIQNSEQLKRTSEITIFKSVGLAIQDISAGAFALKVATEKNIGTVVDL